MRKYTHGGDIYSDENKNIQYDFSANINPCGLPKEVVCAISDMAHTFDKYPDPMCRGLAEITAKKEGIKKEQIVFGNGAADLIFRMVGALKPKHAVVLAPTFSEYEEALNSVQCQVTRYFLKPEMDFSFDEGIMDFVENQEKVDMMFVCNPNNPVGDVVDADTLVKLADILKAKGATLVVDECFLPFTDISCSQSLVKRINDMSNTLVLKAFTKTYAMAGFRLGYMMSSNESVLNDIFKMGQPWSVSSPAQVAGIAALNSGDYLDRSIIYIEAERERLKEALKKEKIHVFDGRANYLLFRVDRGNEFRNAMKERGILIRDCGNYLGLNDDYCRIAVRRSEENDYFIRVLEALKWQKR